MRFQIMCKAENELDFAPLFTVEYIDDAKAIAIRAAMRPGYTVYVYDTKLQERVLDFDDVKHYR